MFKIRQGVFETNSSSTHAMVICSKADYKKLDRGELYIDTWNEKPVTREEVIEEVSEYVDRAKLEALNEDDFRDLVRDHGFDTLGDWDDNGFYRFHEEYTTEHGDEVVAFGYYGFDG